MTINPSQFPKIELPAGKVLARLGYASGKTKIDSKIKEILDEEIAVAGKLIAPRQVQAFSKIALADGLKISLEPCFSIESRDIFKLLDGCAQAAGFAVTIGPALELKRDAYLKDKETTRALVLDAAGSVAAEELAAITNRQIAESAEKNGMLCTRRFSPGYGDWAIASQKDFLEWLGAAQIGIKLSDHFEMAPEKSVSAIIGLKLRVQST